MSGALKDVDRDLRNLAIEAQQCPKSSLRRQQALTRLVRTIQRSGKLLRPYQGQFQGFYEEIYAEALQRLFAFICDRIDDYDPNRAVLQWVNFLLRKRFFIEASREFMPVLPSGVNPKQVTRLEAEALEHLLPQVSSLLSEEVIQCFEEDAEGVFQTTYIAGNPAANFQFIALQRLSGYSWKEISVELGVSVATLSKFYERSLIKFASRLRQYLSR